MPQFNNTDATVLMWLYSENRAESDRLDLCSPRSREEVATVKTKNKVLQSLLKIQHSLHRTTETSLVLSPAIDWQAIGQQVVQLNSIVQRAAETIAI